MLQSSHPGLPSFCDLPHSTWSNLLFSQGSEKICIYRALNFVLFWAVAVVGFALRVGKEGLDAGTKLVPVLSSLPHLLCMPQVFELVTWQSLYSQLGIELLVLYSWLGDYDWASSCVGMVKVFSDATWPDVSYFSCCEIQESNKHIQYVEANAVFWGVGDAHD